MVNRDGFPADLRADAGRERLRHGFFSGETRREMLVRMLHAEAVGAFLGGEDAVEKTVALSIEDATDAVDIDDVGAKSDQDAAGWKREVHQRNISERSSATEYTELRHRGHREHQDFLNRKSCIVAHPGGA